MAITGGRSRRLAGPGSCLAAAPGDPLPAILAEAACLSARGSGRQRLFVGGCFGETADPRVGGAAPAVGVAVTSPPAAVGGGAGVGDSSGFAAAAMSAAPLPLDGTKPPRVKYQPPTAITSMPATARTPRTEEPPSGTGSSSVGSGAAVDPPANSMTEGAAGTDTTTGGGAGGSLSTGRAAAAGGRVEAWTTTAGGGGGAAVDA